MKTAGPPIFFTRLKQRLTGFMGHGMEGYSNFQRLRHITLNVYGAAFILIFVFLWCLRVHQEEMTLAAINSVAILMVGLGLWIARRRSLNVGAWILAIVPVLVAFMMAELDILPAVRAIPQLVLCMVVSLLILDTSRNQLLYLFACLSFLAFFSFTLDDEIQQNTIFLVQILALGLLFAFYAYFFERQDEQLQETIQQLEDSNEETRITTIP